MRDATTITLHLDEDTRVNINYDGGSAWVTIGEHPVRVSVFVGESLGGYGAAYRAADHLANVFAELAVYMDTMQNANEMTEGVKGMSGNV